MAGIKVDIFSSDLANLGRDAGLVEGYLIRSGADTRILEALHRITDRFEDGEDEVEETEGEELENEEEELEEEAEEEAALCSSCSATAIYDVEGHGLKCQACYDEIPPEEEESEELEEEEETPSPPPEPKQKSKADRKLEEDLAWSQHKGAEAIETPTRDQGKKETGEPDEHAGMLADAPDPAEEIKAKQRAMRRWTKEDDELILDYMRSKQKTAFILSELNAKNPDNQRTEGALIQRMWKLKNENNL